MSIAALQSIYQEPDRPISEHEIADRIQSIYQHHRLGSVWAHHNKCGHFYLTRKNSIKEKAVKDGTALTGCTVCWALRSTEPVHKKRVKGLYDTFYHLFTPSPSPPVNPMVATEWKPTFSGPEYTWHRYDIEKIFYDFLYTNT